MLITLKMIRTSIVKPKELNIMEIFHLLKAVESIKFSSTNQSNMETVSKFGKMDKNIKGSGSMECQQALES